MKELIETLEQIDNDYYVGHYTTGEMYDLVNDIRTILKAKHLI